jgi:hypothetical protein
MTSNQDDHQAKNRKKGDEILKKSSPLKLLNQSQPKFAEMILPQVLMTLAVFGLNMITKHG